MVRIGIRKIEITNMVENTLTRLVEPAARLSIVKKKPVMRLNTARNTYAILEVKNAPISLR